MFNVADGLNQINQVLEKIKFPIGTNEISLIYLLQIVFYLIIIVILTTYFNRVLRRKILNKIIPEHGIRYVFSSLISYSIGAFCFIIILQTTGFNLSTLAFLGGGIGIGIGLGLQDVTKNLVSGLSLVLERKIKIGNFIKFNEVEGYVTEISTRAAIIKLEDGSSVIVPNRNLMENRLINYHYKTDSVRLSLLIRVPYETDPVLITETLLVCAYSENFVLQNPPCQVIFKGFGDSCLDFELWIWINSDNMGIRFELLSSLYFSIEHNLRQRNIKIPLAQRELWIRNHELLKPSLTEIGQDNNLIESSSSSLVSIKQRIQQIDYFKPLDDLHIRKIIEIGNLKKLKESDILFRENDPGDAFYVILEGSVEIFTEKLGKTLAILQTGNFFGELALILGSRRTATVKALEETLLFSIHSKQFEKILREHSVLHELIIQELAKNQEELHNRREELRKQGLLTSDEENTHIVAWLRKRLNNILNF